MGKDIGPVVPLVPRDLRERVDCDGHTWLTATHWVSDTACASAAFFAALDVRCYQWIARVDVGA